jgi:hypothetical protein
MFGLPEITESIVRLCLASGDDMWLDEPPYFVPVLGELAEEEASVLDVHVVAPGGQLHREKLVRRQRSRQKSRLVYEELAERETVNISLGRVVQPVVGEIESAADVVPREHGAILPCCIAQCTGGVLVRAPALRAVGAVQTRPVDLVRDQAGEREPFIDPFVLPQ